ncbi:hypothetical protein HHO41_03950 [Bacillus sp. DNRA2]|uniref:hypothetical protein n=1 Tax=Bacillus sp. DNRA2 TaxID=2723053 RepID=UPI00145FAEA7|nr:hypothetical protein [Bacillus sp. DNRA2]NMD69430.1 hypothetical protein [Bacillus sp. DNRA2]
MEANMAQLYSELRKTSDELLTRMTSQNGSPQIQAILKEELADIETAMNKIKTGEFGKCEISGEMIPLEVLRMMPTIKTIKDIDSINSFFRKPFNTI